MHTRGRAGAGPRGPAPLVKARFAPRPVLFLSVPVNAGRLDASGVTNTPNWGDPGTDMRNKATFGVITTAGGSRSMQMAFRAVF